MASSEDDSGSDGEPPVMQAKYSTKARKSVRATGYSSLLDSVQEGGEYGDEEMSARPSCHDQYKTIIQEARRCIGHGAEVGIFPEEWDAQLLIDGGLMSGGERLVIFTPAFLKVLTEDELELDRAFKYILLSMDGFVEENLEYIFVYCHSGMDWTHAHLAHRLRVAYDLLPPAYAEGVKKLYVLHATAFFRLGLVAVRPFLSSAVWNKIVYFSSLDDLIENLCPEDDQERQQLVRRFPQLVQREDCLRSGAPPPLTFGVPLQRLCDSVGVDFTDKTTGRWYPRLPPALIFLCEALERQAADEAFGLMFTADSTVTFDLVSTLDEGEPLDPDTSLPALWCCLKLFVDTLPSPLLGEEAYTALPSDVQRGKQDDQLHFLKKVLHSMSPDAAYMALYLVSFLHTMCDSAKSRPSAKKNRSGGEDIVTLTPLLAAECFTPGFLRPRKMSQMKRSLNPACVSLIKTLIDHAEDEDLWIGQAASKPATNRFSRGSNAARD